MDIEADPKKLKSILYYNGMPISGDFIFNSFLEIINDSKEEMEE